MRLTYSSLKFVWVPKPIRCRRVC